MYFGSYELSDLLEKLGQTHEEVAEILEKGDADSQPLPLTAESERRTRKTTENVH